MTTEKSPDAFRTISEAAEELTVPQHVLRFWETRFSQIKPMKRAGGRRYYRPADLELLKGIHELLYKKGYTIRGVQLILKEEGVAYVAGVGRGEVMPRKSELQEGAPAPGKAPVAPRPGRAPLARPIGEAPKVIHKLSTNQADALRAALKDLGDARKLLDSAS
ncbi:MAG: MerR family transcriptional regulator [Alphaproteobacteria bacterium]|nr:MerR family transcriptional regulator [Alphaproteobacteria bacterium]